MTDSPKLNEDPVAQHTAYVLKLADAVADGINSEMKKRPPPYSDTNFLGSAIFSALTLVMFDLGKALNIPITFIAQQMHQVASSYEAKVASGQMPDTNDAHPQGVPVASDSLAKEVTIDF